MAMISLRDEIVRFCTMISKLRLGYGIFKYAACHCKARHKSQYVAFIFIPKNEAPPSSRVSPTAVPPSAYFEGIHGDRFAWGNTDAIDFVAIASSLLATNSRRGVCNTNRLKAVPLRFVRQLRTQTAQSLVLSVKLGVRFLAALRLAFRLRISTYR